MGKEKYAFAVGLFIVGYLVGFFALCFGAILFLAGMQDWKKHEVYDVYTAAMWFLIFLGNINTYVAVASFGCLYFVNALMSYKKKFDVLGYEVKGHMGWADILGLPPFFAFMLTYGNAGIVACVVGFALFDWKALKVGGPLFPWLMIVLIGTAAAKLLLPL